MPKQRDREVNDVTMLKALADPLRLAILEQLGRHAKPMTVKEIAAALDEPPTKLYRHMKQLETAGLIEVVETRIVSGIVESRYEAAQESLLLSRELFAAAPGDDAMKTMLAVMDTVRRNFQLAYDAGVVDFNAPRDGSAVPPPTGVNMTLDLTVEQLMRYRELLDDFVAELKTNLKQEPDDETVPVQFFALLYPRDPQFRRD